MTSWHHALTPRPRVVIRTDGVLDLGMGLSVRSLGDRSLDGSAILLEQLAAVGVDVVRESDGAPASSRIVCVLGERVERTETEFSPAEAQVFAAQGYTLDVGSDRVVISASEAVGVHHGAMTLLQMLRRAALAGTLVDCGRVVDWPGLELRGYSDDVARGQVPTMEELLHRVAFLGEHKVSHYILYLEDMFEFRSHPAIGAGRGRLTRHEVSQLQEFARTHHVEIVPAFQTLGHLERVLELPAYAHLREHPDNRSLLGPDRPGAYDLITDMLADLAEAFHSRYVVIGADEAFGLGTGSTAQRVAEIGTAGVWIEHVTRVTSLAAQRGKTAVVACDMFDESYYRDVWAQPAPFAPWEVLGLTREAVPAVAAFLPLQRHPLLEDLVRAGYEPWSVTTISNYTRMYPRYVLAEECLEMVALVTGQAGGKGMVASAFCDQGGDNLPGSNHQGMVLLAETAWHPRVGAGRDGTAAFTEQFYGLVDSGLSSVLDLLASSDDLFPRPPVPSRVPPVDVFGMRGWVWFHLWQLLNVEPFLPKLAPAELGLLERSVKQVDEARARLNEARTRVRRHADQLDYLDYALMWIGHTLDRLRILSTARDVAVRENPAAAAASVRVLVSQLRLLESTFEQLWRRTCRAPGLDDNLIRIRTLAEQHDRLADGLLVSVSAR